MTTIRTRCPSCGEVDMAADEISLRLDASGDRGEYGFVCPECSDPVKKPANRKTVALLIAAGVEPALTDPEEMIERPVLPFEDRCPDPAARVFTLDDVIAFHYLLEDDTAISELFSLES
ncbi:MAG TPA: hypothetical protein VEC09_02460 [Actinomycetota bacterium]|jgi:hypothetical protein|nr:hypothetical protein [Actinomycetota bacterium]